MTRFSFQSFDMSYAVAEGDCDTNRLTAEGDTLAPRINLITNLRLSSPAQIQAQLLFSNLGGQLSIPGGPRIADSARGKFLHLVEIGTKANYPVDGPLSFPLDYQRVEELERHRNGGNLTLAFKLTLDVCGLSARDTHHPKDYPAPTPRFLSPTSIESEFTFTIPQSFWVDQILPKLGHGRVVLAEMPAVDPTGYATFEKSYAALKNAQEQHKRGYFDTAAAHCRVALEPFFEPVKKKGVPHKVPVLKRRWKKIIGSATYEWLDRTLGAIRADTNPPHHSPTPRFDLVSAQMIIAVTTVIVGHAARCIPPVSVIPSSKKQS